MDFEKRYRADAKGFRLKPAASSDRGAISKDAAKAIRAADIEALDELQERLYAESARSVLIVLQALDAGGKDSTIEHVMTGVNPQGVHVVSFKQPSSLELSHDFLWRHQIAAPAAGDITIFNRSHYEDVLVVRVHPEYLAGRGIDPARAADDDFWEQRYAAIRNWETQLQAGGTTVIKFLLHVSLETQRERLLARVDTPAKNWKFSPGDVAEREFRPAYEKAFEAMIRATSTDDAPWYVIPADQKWLMRTAVASIIRKRIDALDPQYPTLSEEARTEMVAAADRLRAQT